MSFAWCHQRDTITVDLGLGLLSGELLSAALQPCAKVLKKYSASKNKGFYKKNWQICGPVRRLGKSSMNKHLNWEAFRPCDAVVEGCIAQEAYEAALNELVRGYQHVVISLCRRSLGRAGDGGRAEDIAQEVFLAVYQLFPKKGGAPVRPWLFSIAQMRCLRERRDYTRRQCLMKKNLGTIGSRVHPRAPSSEEERLMLEEELELLRSSLDKLSQYQRALLLDYFQVGVSLTELARTMRISVSEVRRRLNKALERLAKRYKKLL